MSDRRASSRAQTFAMKRGNQVAERVPGVSEVVIGERFLVVLGPDSKNEISEMAL